MLHQPFFLQRLDASCFRSFGLFYTKSVRALMMMILTLLQTTAAHNLTFKPALLLFFISCY